jgi:hypothetical protein
MDNGVMKFHVKDTLSFFKTLRRLEIVDAKGQIAIFDRAIRDEISPTEKAFIRLDKMIQTLEEYEKTSK